MKSLKSFLFFICIAFSVQQNIFDISIGDDGIIFVIPSTRGVWQLQMETATWTQVYSGTDANKIFARNKNSIVFATTTTTFKTITNGVTANAPYTGTTNHVAIDSSNRLYFLTTTSATDNAGNKVSVYNPAAMTGLTSMGCKSIDISADDLFVCCDNNNIIKFSAAGDGTFSDITATTVSCSGYEKIMMTRTGRIVLYNLNSPYTINYRGGNLNYAGYYPNHVVIPPIPGSAFTLGTNEIQMINILWHLRTFA